MANLLPWGFHRLTDIADQQVTDNIVRVRDAVNEYLAFRNAENQAVVSTFAEVTTEVQAKYKHPGAMRLQGLTELGRPRPERYVETEYTVAWPIQKAGLALGQTYEQMVKMNITEIAGLFEALGDADLTWLREHALAALFYNGSGWFHDDPDDPAGELTIKGLANGDTQQYFKAGASGFMATDQHYIAQTTDLVTASDPIPNMRDELVEHPENTGDTIIIGSTVDRAKYTALAAFYAQPDPNLTVGTGTTQFTGSAPAAPLGEFLGYHLSGAFIYLWRGMPTNYLIGFTTGGPKALRQREHPEAQLRGFRPETDREDYPYLETPYVRRAGFGGWNRVGAVAQQVNGGDTTFDIPTNYGSPRP